MVSAYDMCKQSVKDLKAILTSESLLDRNVTFVKDFYKGLPRSRVIILEKQKAKGGGMRCFYHAIHCLLNRFCFSHSQFLAFLNCCCCCCCCVGGVVVGSFSVMNSPIK